MLELDWRVESRGGVALVELLVRNPTATARRVRVANRLGGPVWPPRREGVPAAGWDDGGFEGVVASDDRRALGYASPTASADDSLPEPPAEVVWSERAGASEADVDPATGAVGDAAGGVAVEATPEGVVRALGDARPPADAVPSPRSRPERDLPADASADAADQPRRRSP